MTGYVHISQLVAISSDKIQEKTMVGPSTLTLAQVPAIRKWLLTHV